MGSGANSNKTSSVMLTVNDIIIKMNKKRQNLRHYEREYSWKEMLQSLKRYRKIHGNCNVPKGYKNKKLVRWTNLQRRQYKLFFDGKVSDMTVERIFELENLDFDWK